MKFYSQYKQDEWLYNNYFNKQPNGIFLEIGADDGIDKSNTKFFEDIGWTGICIEPSVKRFELLKNNRNCICENYAISTNTGSTKFMDINGYGKGLSGIVDNYNDEHKKRIEWEIKHPENKGYNIIDVKTELLTNLLDKHNINYVDFCSIDTEGSEYDILKTIDFNKYSIKIIMVENNYNDDRVYNLLINNGYKKVNKLVIDDIYIKKDI
jgi:FkbM family methyltransferase